MSPTHFSESTLVSFRVSVDFLIKASLSVVLGEEPSTVSMSEGPSLVTEMLFFLQQRWRSCCWGSCSVYINLLLSNFEMKRNAAELMFLFMCGRQHMVQLWTDKLMTRLKKVHKYSTSFSLLEEYIIMYLNEEQKHLLKCNTTKKIRGGDGQKYPWHDFLCSYFGIRLSTVFYSFKSSVNILHF